MNIHEYQGKALLREYGVPVPRGFPAFTVEEAASLLGISRSFAYEAIQRGEIPSMRIGKRILVPKAALERHLLISGSAASAATPANAPPRSIGVPDSDEQNDG